MQTLEDYRKYWLYQYCRYWKILENTGYTNIAHTGRLAAKLRNVLGICTSVADTGRFWLNTGNTSIVYNTGNTSIAAGLSKH
jgi:hypothetical protein